MFTRLVQERKRTHRGFSIIELMISLSISAVVAVTIWQILKRQLQTSTQTIKEGRGERVLENFRESLIEQIKFAPRLSEEHPIVAFGIQPLYGKSYNPSTDEIDLSNSQVDGIRIVAFKGREPALELKSNMATPDASIALEDTSGILVGSLWTITALDWDFQDILADLFEVTGVNTDSIEHQTTANGFNASDDLSTSYGVPAFLYPVIVVEYGLDTTNSENGVLMTRRDQSAFSPVVDGISALQIWYRYHDGQYNPTQGGVQLLGNPNCSNDTICRDISLTGPVSFDPRSRIFDVTVRLILQEEDGDFEIFEQTVQPRNFSNAFVERSLE